MHETHLIQPVIDNIQQHAQKESAKKVTKVRLKVGVMSGVKEASCRETFVQLAKGTLLEDAEVEITEFPGTGVQIISFDID